MRHFLAYFLVLGLAERCTCELSLKILKCTEKCNNFVPVSSVVEEKVGTNFSLLCDLMSDGTNSEFYDFQISWFKPSNDIRFWREEDLDDNGKSKKIYSILKPSEMNKAVKKFEPLRLEDKGKYYCVSLKFSLHEMVEVIVRDERPHFVEDSRNVYMQQQQHHPQEPMSMFCSGNQWECQQTGVCIIAHYVCDGKADCKDGSDESAATCNGDPCRDKLHCEDGRCIPTTWCCDRYHDPNCTVTNRPKCCQILSESYEELEYGSSRVTQTHNGARYIFISVCVLSILFVIVLILLVLSKVLIFANKESGLGRHHHHHHVPGGGGGVGENIALRGCRSGFIDCDLPSYAAYQSRMGVYRGVSASSSSATPRSCLTSDGGGGSECSDPLLYPSDYCPVPGGGTACLRDEMIVGGGGGGGGGGADEQPPPYVDVIRNNNNNLNEPPPPYTSRETLNTV